MLILTDMMKQLKALGTGMIRMWVCAVLSTIWVGCSLGTPPSAPSFNMSDPAPKTDAPSGSPSKSSNGTSRSNIPKIDSNLPSLMFQTYPQSINTQLIPAKLFWSHAFDDKCIYVGTPAGLAISCDKGITWKTRTVADGLPSNFITRVAVSNSRIVAQTTAGLAISEDNGATWSKISSLNLKDDNAELITLYGKEIFLIDDNKFIASKDGMNFTSSSTEYRGVEKIIVSSEAVMIVTDKSVFTSKDRGKTFSEETCQCQFYTHQNSIIRTENNTHEISIDGGISFSALSIDLPEPDASLIGFTEKGALAYKDQNIYYTQNRSNPSAWKAIKHFKGEISNPPGSSMPSFFEINERLFVISAEENEPQFIFNRLESNDEWTSLVSNNEIGVLPVYQLWAKDKNILVLYEGDYLVESTNSGSTFERRHETSAFYKSDIKLWTTTDLKTSNDVEIRSIHGNNDSACYATNDGIYIVKDQEMKHFGKIDGLPSNNTRACYLKDSILIVATVGGSAVSKDSGSNWKVVLNDSSTAIAEFKGNYYIGTNRGYQFSSDLKSWKFKNLSSRSEGNFISGISSSDKMIGIGTSEGAYFSIDGENFTLKNSKNSRLEGNVVKAIHIDGLNAYVGTVSGLSIFRSEDN